MKKWNHKLYKKKCDGGGVFEPFNHVQKNVKYNYGTFVKHHVDLNRDIFWNLHKYIVQKYKNELQYNPNRKIRYYVEPPEKPLKSKPIKEKPLKTTNTLQLKLSSSKKPKRGGGRGRGRGRGSRRSRGRGSRRGRGRGSK